MKIVLMSVGTRGDMEPFLAIGEILKRKGHEVICAFPEQFRYLVENGNMEFFSLGSKFIELLDSDEGKAALGGSSSGLRKLIAFIKLATRQTEINKELINKQYELVKQVDPGRIVYNGKAVYPIIVELNNRGTTILVSPVPYMHYVKDNTHVAFNSNFGTFLNKLTYSLADFGMITTVKISARWLKIKERISRKQIRKVLHSNKVIYTISPSLFQRPDYWHNNLKIFGYQQYKTGKKGPNDRDLVDFIQKHRNEKLLMVTFGSMTNPAPEAKTGVLINILQRNKLPAIINIASGGLAEPGEYDHDLLYFVSDISYDWLFPKLYGVIHHGGSGTTHLALKYGCATMIIPHIIDQFVWNKIIHSLGAGPMGPGINKFTTNKLEAKILDLVNNDTYKKKAKQIARQIQGDDFTEELYQFIVG